MHTYFAQTFVLVICRTFYAIPFLLSMQKKCLHFNKRHFDSFFILTLLLLRAANTQKIVYAFRAVTVIILYFRQLLRAFARTERVSLLYIFLFAVVGRAAFICIVFHNFVVFAQPFSSISGKIVIICNQLKLRSFSSISFVRFLAYLQFAQREKYLF